MRKELEYWGNLCIGNRKVLCWIIAIFYTKFCTLRHFCDWCPINNAGGSQKWWRTNSLTSTAFCETNKRKILMNFKSPKILNQLCNIYVKPNFIMLYAFDSTYLWGGLLNKSFVRSFLFQKQSIYLTTAYFEGRLKWSFIYIK